jgi:hypothetical protein
MTTRHPHILLRIILLMTPCMLSGCQRPLLDSLAYGRIPSHGQDPYGQGFIVQIPASAPSISQRYQPDEDAGKTQYGLDIIGIKGTPIIAAAGGIVVSSRNSFWGNHVVLNHGADDEGWQIFSEYAHLDKRTVQSGQVVHRGQQLGTMGGQGYSPAASFTCILVSPAAEKAAPPGPVMILILIRYGVMVRE